MSERRRKLPNWREKMPKKTLSAQRAVKAPSGGRLQKLREKKHGLLYRFCGSDRLQLHGANLKEENESCSEILGHPVPRITGGVEQDLTKLIDLRRLLLLIN
jgi:hypothetical protein